MLLPGIIDKTQKQESASGPAESNAGPPWIKGSSINHKKTRERVRVSRMKDQSLIDLQTTHPTVKCERNYLKMLRSFSRTTGKAHHADQRGAEQPNGSRQRNDFGGAVFGVVAVGFR